MTRTVTRSGSRRRRWGTIPRRCIMPAQNTPTCPAVVPLCGTKVEVTVPSLDDWEKEWGKIHNAACNQSCCQWISGRRWLPSRNRISLSWASQSFGLRRQASWLKVWRGGGCNFSATERAHKRNGGQVDAEWRLPSLVTTSTTHHNQTCGVKKGWA